MTDPVKAIARQLQRRCTSFATASISEERSAPWRSLLFDGARHRIALHVSGERVDDAIDAIRAEVDGADFVIFGHLIAEIRIAEIDHGGSDARITLDAVTVESR